MFEFLIRKKYFIALKMRGYFSFDWKQETESYIMDRYFYLPYFPVILTEVQHSEVEINNEKENIK